MDVENKSFQRDASGRQPTSLPESAPETPEIEMSAAADPANLLEKFTAAGLSASTDGLSALRAAKEFAESIVQTVPDALLVLDTHLRVQSANDAFYALFQVKPEETLGTLIYDLGDGQWDIPELRTLLEDILSENRTFTGYEVDHTFEQIGRRTMLLNGRRLDHAQLILLAIADITERKQVEIMLRRSEERQTYLLRLSDALRPLTDPAEIQRIACRMLGEQLEVNRVQYVDIIDEKIAVIAQDYAEGVASIRTQVPITIYGEQALILLRSGRTDYTHNIETDPRLTEAERAILRAAQIAALIAAGLVKGGRWVAILGVHSITPRLWTEWEVRLVEETAARTWDTVERARAEEALRQSESRFRTLADLVPDLLWSNDPQGILTWYNQRWYEYIGQTLEAIGAHGWLDAIHPDERAQTWSGFQAALNTGRPWRQEHRIRRVGGEYRWFLSQAVPVYNETGGISQWYGAATDIHEQRTAWELLRRQVEEFQAHFSMRTVGNAQADVQTGRLLLVNQGLCEITGYREEELLARTFWELAGAEDLDRARYAELIRGERASYDLEKRLIRKNGEVRWIMVTVTVAQHDAEGRPVRTGALVLDITERKLAQDALLTSKEWLRVTMESITDYAIITLDAAGVITGWNIGAQQMFGYSPDEAIGQPGALIFTPEDRAAGAPEAELEQARTQGRAADERWHMRKDGSRFYVSGVMTPLNDARMSGFVKVARDLTDRRKLEERLEAQVRERTVQVRELVTQLTLSEQEERRRISSILHDDLQQVLFGLIFQIHSLRHMLADSAPQSCIQIMSEIEETLQNSVRVTRELSVDLSPPVLYNEGLIEAIRWLANQMQRQYGLEVVLTARRELPLIDDDMRVLLFQTIRELLFNVVKHAGVSTAQVTLDYVEGQTLIVVADQGKGFDAEHAHNQSGNHQGLQRIRHRLQLLGGRMEVISAPGQGVRVMLSSPAQGRKEGNNRGNTSRR